MLIHFMRNGSSVHWSSHSGCKPLFLFSGKVFNGLSLFQDLYAKEYRPVSRSVAELKQLALYEKQTFHRTVSTEVYLTEEGGLSICKLHDNYHDMELALLIDLETFVIKDIAVIMNRHPFEDCIRSYVSYERLIGLKVMGGGVLHQVHQLIPRVDGCTHLYTALEAALRALFIGAGYEGIRSRTTPGSRAEHQEMLRQHPLTKNTCVSFRTDGKFPESPAVFLGKLESKSSGTDNRNER